MTHYQYGRSRETLKLERENKYTLVEVPPAIPEVCV